MKLKDLIKNLEVIEIIGELDVNVTDITTDSKRVSNGSMFICISGENSDGHCFIRQAEGYGAVAVITEKKLDTSLVQIIVKNTRIAVGIVASEFYGNPSKKLKIIGVVGTNGKTTTTHIIKTLVEKGGIKCGVIGTLGTFYGNNFIEPTLTTPDPLELHKLLADMVSDGVKVVVMEVSAHALYFDKVNGLCFEVGVFTNFTRDHLDFFKDMNNYKKAKLKFFDLGCKFIVSNSDDEVGREIINNNKKVISYGIDNPSDVFAIDINEERKGTSYVLNLFDCIFDVNLKLIGRYNVYNTLAASAVTALLGVKTEKIAYELNNITCVSGRLERVLNDKFSIFIDYAHTPDGLEKVLTALRKVCKKRLICVFGCGGNRDCEKRPMMGKISGKYADFTVITSDNPRYEEPIDIITQIEQGMLETSGKYVVVQDREQGIEYALNFAEKDDTVLIAGKGSEKYQEILGIKHTFNDKDTVEEILRKLKL